MKRILVGLLALALAPAALAADTASHNVTVTVSAINEVAIVGGDISLTIDSATADGSFVPATDSTTDLQWTTNEAGRKITVATDLAAPAYGLQVEATNISDGSVAAGPVALSTTATDLVTGIANTAGAADLSYTATADASAAVGTETHVVTYTITGA